MYDDIFADGIDGVHGLRRRPHTRLWFRALPPVEIVPDHLRAAIQLDPHLTVTAPDLVESTRIRAVHAEPNSQTDLLVGERPAEDTSDAVVSEQPSLSTEERQTRMLRRLGSHLSIAPIAAEPAADQVREPLTDWRLVPRNAPTLLLSATELLDGRQPGPILGPGKRYRVFSAAEGVVGLEVMQHDGEIAAGYCNAVDLLCIEPTFANLAGAGRGAGTRQRFRQITKGLNQVTTSLGAFMS